MGFYKTTQTSGLYNSQQEKLIACFMALVYRREDKNKNFVASCLVIGITKEMDETSNY